MTKLKFAGQTIRTAIVLAAFLWPTWLFSQTSFFISPQGNDSNPGTQVKPFGSLNRAQMEARKTSGSIVVYRLEGTYYLSQPVVFMQADSRKENETLTLTNCVGWQEMAIAPYCSLKM